jgi:Tfp pilus assembly protein PilF
LKKKDLFRSAPFFGIALLIGIVNVWFMSHANVDGIRTATVAQRVLGAGAVVWFYLYKAILPLDLAFIYPPSKVPMSSELRVIPITATVVLGFALWRWRSTRLGRIGFVAWMSFVIALLPVMGLSDTGFMRYSLVADHYQHIAIIAVVALAGAALSQITNYKLQIGIVAVLAGVLTVKAMQQATIYRDPITLYRAAVAKNPGMWMLHGNLADELLQGGKVDEAIGEFRETLRLNAQSDDAHYFYSKALEKNGDIDGAMVELKEVTKLPAEHYQFDAYHELAMIFLARGDKQQALAMEESAKALVVKHGLDQVAAQCEAWMKANGLK